MDQVVTLRQKILPIQQFEGEIDYEVQQQREPRPVGPQWSYHYFTGILSPNLFRKRGVSGIGGNAYAMIPFHDIDRASTFITRRSGMGEINIGSLRFSKVANTSVIRVSHWQKH